MELEELSTEILFEIFKLLDTQDLIRCLRVNKYIRTIASDEKLWEGRIIKIIPRTIAENPIMKNKKVKIDLSLMESGDIKVINYFKKYNHINLDIRFDPSHLKECGRRVCKICEIIECRCYSTCHSLSKDLRCEYVCNDCAHLYGYIVCGKCKSICRGECNLCSEQNKICRKCSENKICRMCEKDTGKTRIKFNRSKINFYI
jgi:hypothetical protein